MNEFCIIFQKIDCRDLIRYMETTSTLDFLHKTLSCREFLIFKLINDFHVDPKEVVDMDMKNLIKQIKTLQDEREKPVNLLRFSNNKIIDVTPLKNLQNLQLFCLSNNKITDVSPLKNLNFQVWL